MTPILLTETLLEGTTGHYDFTLDIDAGFLTTLTVTYYDVETLQVLNGRDHQDIHNANGGTVTTEVGPPVVTTVLLELSPADTVIVNPQRRVEYRVLSFHWSWDGGARHGAHVVQFGIENLELEP